MLGCIQKGKLFGQPWQFAGQAEMAKASDERSPAQVGSGRQIEPAAMRAFISSAAFRVKVKQKIRRRSIPCAAPRFTRSNP